MIVLRPEKTDRHWLRLHQDSLLRQVLTGSLERHGAAMTSQVSMLGSCLLSGRCFFQNIFSLLAMNERINTTSKWQLLHIKPWESGTGSSMSEALKRVLSVVGSVCHRLTALGDFIQSHGSETHTFKTLQDMCFYICLSGIIICVKTLKRLHICDPKPSIFVMPH